MIDHQEWQGTWFINLPDGSELAFGGILSYDLLDGCVLKASTSENSDQFLDFIADNNRIELIKGFENTSHKGLLLKKCIITNALQNFGLSVKIKITEIIECVSYEEDIELIFNKAMIEYSVLGEWLDIESLEIKTHHENDPSIDYSFVYRKPQNFTLTINSNIDLKFWFGYSVRRDDEIRSSHLFSSGCYISIIPKSGSISDDTLDKYSEHLRRLLAIFYHQYCFIISHRYVKDNLYMPFYKYYKQNKLDSKNDYPKAGRAIVKYVEIEAIMEPLLQKWFVYRESDDMNYVTYIASKSLNPFSEEVFLENARALEVYHKTKYKNKRTFKVRIKELLDEIKLSSENQHYNLFFPDPDRFTDLIIKNRNYLTHYGDGSINDKDKMEIEELYWLAQQCKVIQLTSICKDLGVDSKKVFSRLFERYRLMNNSTNGKL